jgi:hypothetical protein
MKWIFENARHSFDRHQRMWDDLNKERGNHILLDSIFVGALIRHFASPKALLGIAENGAGMIVVDSSYSGFWRSFQPSQAPLGLVLLRDEHCVVEQIRELFRSLPGYALGVAITQQDPDFTVFANTTADLRLAETLEYITTSRINIKGEFDEYWKNRGRYYVDDLRRQTRRLEEQKIHMEFQEDLDVRNMGECIKDYGKLEEVGWKGEEGTAVGASNQQGRFYREILERFCCRGEAVVYKLLFNGQTVASDLCLRRDGMLVVLKIAYDEGFQKLSPGKFIHREILRSLFRERKIRTLEWYGRLHEWQRKLDSVPRTMFHVNIYRNEWIPMARRIVKGTWGLVNQAKD